MICFSIATFFCVAFFVAGCMSLAWLPDFINEQIKDKMNLATPTSFFYTTFVNQSEKVQIYKVFTFYNITNLPQVVDGSEYPNVTEHGPYYYQRVRVHTQDDISWRPNGTIIYRWSETYKFRPELSTGSEDDLIFTARLGPIFAFQEVSATNFSKIGHYVFRDKAPEVKTLFVNKTVSELVHGYKEDFLVQLAQADPYVGVSPDVANVSYSEVYNGGEASTTQPVPPARSFGEFTMWKGRRDLTHIWTTPATQKLIGTDGTTFAPFLDDVPELTAFVEALYRPVILQYKGDAKYKGDLPVRVYSPRSDQFNDAERTPHNAGFRIFQQGFQPRPPVQAIPDKYILGAISKQHYLDCAGPHMNVKIGAPDADKDETVLQFEPNTATVVSVRKRSLLSVMLRDLPYKDIYNFTQHLGESNVLKQTWLPYVAETEETDLPDHLREKLMMEVVWPKRLAKPVGGALVGITLVAQLLLIYFSFFRTSTDRSRTGSENYTPSEREYNREEENYGSTY